MARIPLPPPGVNLAFWVNQFAVRYERDYSALQPKSGTVSLSATVSNIVTNINCDTLSRVFLQPITTQAAQAQAWVSSKAAGRFVIATTVSATPSCVFDYLIIPAPPT